MAWERLGGVLGRLGSSWAVLGASWVPLESNLAHEFSKKMTGRTPRTPPEVPKTPPRRPRTLPRRPKAPKDTPGTSPAPSRDPKMIDFGTVLNDFLVVPFDPVHPSEPRAHTHRTTTNREKGKPNRFHFRYRFGRSVLSRPSVRTPSPQTSDHRSGNGVGGCPEGHAVSGADMPESHPGSHDPTREARLIPSSAAPRILDAPT